MSDLNPRGDRPLYQQLADILRGEIVNGSFSPGSFLPSEQTLCNDHDVKLTTVRRAMAILRQEGLVSTRRGYPTCVRPQLERKEVVLASNDRLVCRVPTQPERIKSGVEEGVPVVEIRRSDGRVEHWAGDRVIVVGANQC
jgi:DNA-binding transcriptional regulator YhcF (GntR family)